MNYCILLTACICPNGMGDTMLQDATQRREQYEMALRYYLSETRAPIVFVENSGSDISGAFLDAIQSGRLEVLTFYGNDYEKSFGKGYGEAMIIQYAIRHSRIIAATDYILKITGRLKLINIRTLINDIRLGPQVDVIVSWICQGLLDSRVVWARPDFWLRSFLPEIYLLNDSKNYYFEHLLHKSLSHYHWRGFYFALPYFDGISGTMGTRIPHPSIKSKEYWRKLKRNWHIEKKTTKKPAKIAYSIIIPLYNKAEAIGSTLNSVLSQVYQNYEIIIVDDGSTDNSLEVVSSFQDTRIRCIRKENGGVSSARNRGMAEAKNEWILLLDADDTLEPTALSTMQCMIEAYPTESVFIGNYRHSDTGHLRCRAGRISKAKLAPDAFRAFWDNRLAPKIGAFVFHKTAIERCGTFDERLSFFEDFDFTSRLMSHYSFVYTTVAVMTYQIGYASLSGYHHSIEKEYAYYMTPDGIKGSFWKQLVFAENVRYCQYVRALAQDSSGVKFYQQLYQRLFSRSCKILFWVIDLRKKISNRLMCK